MNISTSRGHKFHMLLLKPIRTCVSHSALLSNLWPFWFYWTNTKWKLGAITYPGKYQRCTSVNRPVYSVWADSYPFITSSDCLVYTFHIWKEKEKRLLLFISLRGMVTGQSLLSRLDNVGWTKDDKAIIRFCFSWTVRSGKVRGIKILYHFKNTNNPLNS